MTSLEGRHSRTPTDVGGPSWLVNTSARTTADTTGRRRMCHRCAMSRRNRRPLHAPSCIPHTLPSAGTRMCKLRATVRSIVLRTEAPSKRLPTLIDVCNLREGDAVAARTQSERSAAMQQALVDAAIELLIERGWAATTAVAVCERVGLHARRAHPPLPEPLAHCSRTHSSRCTTRSLDRPSPKSGRWRPRSIACGERSVTAASRP